MAKVFLKYNFNMRDSNSKEIINYFNKGDFENYMGAKQKITFSDTREINGRLFQVALDSSDLGSLEKVFSKQVPFIPNEVICKKSEDYLIVEDALKNQRGNEYNFSRNFVDKLMNRSIINKSN